MCPLCDYNWTLHYLLDSLPLCLVISQLRRTERKNWPGKSSAYKWNQTPLWKLWRPVKIWIYFKMDHRCGKSSNTSTTISNWKGNIEVRRNSLNEGRISMGIGCERWSPLCVFVHLFVIKNTMKRCLLACILSSLLSQPWKTCLRLHRFVKQLFLPELFSICSSWQEQKHDL